QVAGQSALLAEAEAAELETTAPVVQDADETTEAEPSKGRRRTRGGRSRKPRAEEAETPAEAPPAAAAPAEKAVEPASPPSAEAPTPKPKLMDSAGRRTDENDTAAAPRGTPA